jgi:hypothetical protein
MKNTVMVLFCVAIIAYVVFDSETVRELVFKWKGLELGMKQGSPVPPKELPDSGREQTIPKPAQLPEGKPTMSLPPGSVELTNVALSKPVTYLAKPITLGGELWDAAGYYERYSINKGNYPSNLTDGNLNTVAYPASWFLDYIVDLAEVYEIEKINLVWGIYGKKDTPAYITAWRLSAQKELTGDWQTVEFRDYLNEEKTVLNFPSPISARRLRIYAESFDRDKNLLLNWIGIHELEAYGKPIGIK